MREMRGSRSCNDVDVVLVYETVNKIPLKEKKRF